MFRDELDKKIANPDPNFMAPDEKQWRMKQQEQEQRQLKEEQVSKYWATVAWDRIKNNVLGDFPRCDPKTNKELPWVFFVMFERDYVSRCPIRLREQIQYLPINGSKWTVVFDKEEATEIIRKGFFSRETENHYVARKAVEFFKELVQADGLSIELDASVAWHMKNISWWERYRITYKSPNEREESK